MIFFGLMIEEFMLEDQRDGRSRIMEDFEIGKIWEGEITKA